MKAVLTAICNDMALDVFTADGNWYDKSKFHNYSYYSRRFTVLDEGKWSSTDGGITWHVDQLLIQNNEFGSYFRYNFDVRFDGRYYYCENGYRVGSARLDWLVSEAYPSKLSQTSLSNLEIYSFCIVSPKQIDK